MMYENSGSCFFRATTGIQLGTYVLEELRAVIILLGILEVTSHCDVTQSQI